MAATPFPLSKLHGRHTPFGYPGHLPVTRLLTWFSWREGWRERACGRGDSLGCMNRASPGVFKPKRPVQNASLASSRKKTRPWHPPVGKPAQNAPVLFCFSFAYHVKDKTKKVVLPIKFRFRLSKAAIWYLFGFLLRSQRITTLIDCNSLHLQPYTIPNIYKSHIKQYLITSHFQRHFLLVVHPNKTRMRLVSFEFIAIYLSSFVCRIAIGVANPYPGRHFNGVDR